MKHYLGIDPGQTGAMAVIDQTGRITALVDWPGDEVAMADQIRDVVLLDRITLAVVEQQQAMPKQGVASTFKLGQNFGVHLGILAALGVSYRLVRPSEWKKGFVPPHADKSLSLAVARRLFPDAELHLKKHHGRAEALLLAEYARRSA